MEKKPHKRKRGRNLKQTPSPFTNSTSSNDLVPSPPTLVYRRGRVRQRKTPTHDSDTQIAASSESDRGVEDFSDHDFELAAAPPSLGKVMHSMDAVVKVFCVHTEPNFSLPWQRKRQYSSSSSGFIIGGRRVLTNAHSVEHYTQVKLKKRGSDIKYLATVLAIGTECDIERELIVEGITWYFKKGGFSASHSRFCL